MQPARRSHPLLSVSAVDQADVVPDYFPHDAYDIEACPCTERLFARPPGTTWQVSMRQARAGRFTLVPCGLVRANAMRTGLQLIVLPYNYPLLLPLLGMHSPAARLSAAPYCRHPNLAWPRAMLQHAGALRSLRGARRRQRPAMDASRETTPV